MKINVIEFAESIKKANKQFEFQTKLYTSQGNSYKAEVNEIHQQLFNISIYLSIDDWKKIRNKKYYEYMDAIQKSDFLNYLDKQWYMKIHTIDMICEYFNTDIHNIFFVLKQRENLQ